MTLLEILLLFGVFIYFGMALAIMNECFSSKEYQELLSEFPEYRLQTIIIVIFWCIVWPINL